MNFRLALLLLALLLPAQAAGEHWRQGRLVYRRGVTRSLIAGRTDLFYDGKYTCTPGAEHYAPDCREISDWFVTEGEQAEIKLEDGRTIDLISLAGGWRQLVRGVVEGGSTQVAFEYRLRPRKYYPNQDEILVRGTSPKGLWWPLPSLEEQEIARELRQQQQRLHAK